MAAVVVAALFGCSNDGDYDDENDLTTEVVACEEAYARLERCCPDFRVALGGSGRWDHLCHDESYQETQHGCEGYYAQDKGHVRPAIGTAESECIRRTSCEALVASGVCTRAENARARGSSSYYEDDPSNYGSGSPEETSGTDDHPSEGVCP